MLTLLVAAILSAPPALKPDTPNNIKIAVQAGEAEKPVLVEMWKGEMESIHKQLRAIGDDKAVVGNARRAKQKPLKSRYETILRATEHLPNTLRAAYFRSPLSTGQVGQLGSARITKKMKDIVQADVEIFSEAEGTKIRKVKVWLAIPPGDTKVGPLDVPGAWEVVGERKIGATTLMELRQIDIQQWVVK